MPEAAPPQDEQMRVAFSIPNSNPDLRIVHRTQTLKDLIQELAEQHKLPGTGADYSLVFQKGIKIKDYRIVTEKNRSEMNAKYGNVIEIAESASKSVSNILLDLEGGDGEKRSKALSALNRMSVDYTFALEFFSRKGLSQLMGLISNNQLQRVIDIVKVLGSIVLLMEQEVVSVDDLISDREFISAVARFMNAKDTDVNILKHSIQILVISVRGGESLENIEHLERQLALTNLVSLLSKGNSDIQIRSLRLINSLLQAVSLQRKTDMVRMLSEKPSRTIVKDHLLAPTVPDDVRAALDNELYILQYHILQRQINERMMTKIEPQDSLALQKIKDLRSTAFDTDSPNVKNNTRFAQDYKKLGFNNDLDPTLDFMAVPPGVLALDCMDYFAKNHPDQFTKVVLENSCRSDNHECPFAASSIELVKLLGEILGIGKPPLTGPNIKFHEMFFKCEYPFEEFYTHCVIILNKTWREMRATREDFKKVFDVVREQIEKALQGKTNSGPKTFDEFRNKVKSYTDISKKWQKDANAKDPWKESEPVKVLKAHLSHEIEELIQQQRCNFMVEGTKFQRLKKNGEVLKGQYRYIKLHTNHKTIYVGDWNSDKSVPTIEDLEPKIQVQDIKDIQTGASCVFLKEYGQKVVPELQKTAFSVLGENGSLDCVAADELTFNYWIDGFNTLLGKKMSSGDYLKEKEILLNMEVKLRLLDLEGVDLPSSPPPIPPPPAHLNFSSSSR